MAKAMGILLMAAGIWVWLSYDYPNVSPFGFGTVFAAGMFGQVLNWLLVCVLAGTGWFLFTIGGKRKNADSGKSSG